MTVQILSSILLINFLNLTPELLHKDDTKAAVKISCINKGSCLFDIEMIYVKGGVFNMGNDKGENDEKPIHTVEVSDYYISKHEITVAQFDQFVKETKYVTTAERAGWCYVWVEKKWEKRKDINWRHDMDGNIRPESDYNHPVIFVSWNDANAFCKWYSEKTGSSFRLPTEAEWEFAARGGNKSRDYDYSGSNDPDKVAWCWFNSGKTTHAAGTKSPNELGIYDMSGNVWEWCLDYYNPEYYSVSPGKDPTGPQKGPYKVLRGGSWDWDVYFAGVTLRNWSHPRFRYSNYGFRIARSV